MRQNDGFRTPFVVFLSCFWQYHHNWTSKYLALIAIILLTVTVSDIAGDLTGGQQQLLRIIAVPWLDKHPSDNHRLSHQTTTCSLAVSPVTTDYDLGKGIFVHFDLAGTTHIVRASLFNGRFCSVDVFLVEPQQGLLIQPMASTKIQYQILDIKAVACRPNEAYIVAILTKDGLASEAQLLVYKQDENDSSGRRFVIAHNGHLAGVKGVSDAAIRCVENVVIFGLAVSSSLLPDTGRNLVSPSEIRVWSPKSRSVVKQLMTETVNAISVVAFESGRCLNLVFMQKSNTAHRGPLDSLVYCITLERRTGWSLTLIQRLNLCEVNGVEFYVNSKQEMGLFVAMSKKADEYPACPKTSLSMKWTGKQFVPYGNVSVQAPSDFYYLSTVCCNLLLTRHFAEERALTFVGSTEPLFEGVHKMEFITINARNFLLISFANDIHHGALHELLCDDRSQKTLPFGPPGWMAFSPAPYPITGGMMHVTPPQMGLINPGSRMLPPPPPRQPSLSSPGLIYLPSQPPRPSYQPPFQPASVYHPRPPTVYPNPPPYNQPIFMAPDYRGPIHSYANKSLFHRPAPQYSSRPPIRTPLPPIPHQPVIRPVSAPIHRSFTDIAARPWIVPSQSAAPPPPPPVIMNSPVFDPRTRKRVHAYDGLRFL